MRAPEIALKVPFPTGLVTRGDLLDLRRRLYIVTRKASGPGLVWVREANGWDMMRGEIRLAFGWFWLAVDAAVLELKQVFEEAQ